ncbi:heterokaryon incompatibility protein-domain-containing protein [Xylariaceae sp. FL0662B]|nr:heterokaryon incompatibility protein-domain-containing protein [Xylariaceae sp. FL0662B]
MDCSRCRSLTIRYLSEEVRDEPTPLHNNGAELVSGVESGCWWCMRIFYSACRQFPEVGLSSYLGTPPLKPPNFQFTSSATGGPLSRNNTTLCVDYTLESHAYYVYFYHHSRRQFASEIGHRTDSQQSWNYISTRLKNCEDHHNRCKQVSGWYPSRLIEVSGTQAEPVFRIVTKTDGVVDGPYITLSHRWFPDGNLKLTSENLSKYQRGIPSNLMPRKYLDAAMVTRKLDVQYLWIDSLCILQDSCEDWDRESSMMGLIYQNGYCNLAAASATNSSEGLFYHRHPSQIFDRPCDRSAREESIFITQFGDDSRFMLLDQEPLNRRGWVCQERQLANRNISFTREMIYYECAEEGSCEIGFLDRNNIDMWKGVNRLLTVGTPSQDNILSFWERFVEHYSASDVTIPGDKLAAIAGVASICHKTIQSDYLAGLWKANLPQGLLWVRTGARVRRPNEYRAPSWSWASIDSVVRYWDKGKTKPLVDITNAYATCIGSNGFGSIRDARIQLVGWLFPLLSRDCTRDYEQLDREEDYVSKIDFSLECITRKVRRSSARFDITRESNVDSCIRDGLMPTECYLLPICRGLAMSTIHALLVAAVTPSQGVYRRIGYIGFEESVDSLVGRTLGYKCEDNSSSALKEMTNEWAACDIPSHERMSDGRRRITLV